MKISLIICAVLFFICGMGMYYVLAELFGYWGLFISLPLAGFIGWTTGSLIGVGERI